MFPTSLAEANSIEMMMNDDDGDDEGDDYKLG